MNRTSNIKSDKGSPLSSLEMSSNVHYRFLIEKDKPRVYVRHIEFPCELSITLGYEEGVYEEYTGFIHQDFTIANENNIVEIENSIKGVIGVDKHFVIQGVKFKLARMWWSMEEQMTDAAYNLLAYRDTNLPLSYDDYDNDNYVDEDRPY